MSVVLQALTLVTTALMPDYTGKDVSTEYDATPVT
jgi:hypothetical protein